MRSLNRQQDPSLRFLLWLEWILLGLTALGELSRRIHWLEGRSPLLNLACIALLAILGLRLPKEKLMAKLGYLTLNLGLILLTTLIGQLRFFFLLCVVLMVRSGLLLERGARWLSMAVLTATFLVLQAYRMAQLPASIFPNRFQTTSGEPRESFLLVSFLLFSLVLVFSQFLMNALLAERHSREQLAIAHGQLRQYALRVEDIATLQERTRIAREIHDSLGHSLTALNLNINAALGLWEQEPSEAHNLITEAKSLSQAALKDVRQSVSTLRNDPRASQPLAALVETLLHQFKGSAGLPIHCHFEPVNLDQEHPLPEAHRLAAYRIIQEALTNILKYAQASEVHIQIMINPKLLSLQVRDNGRGFDRSQTSSGFGLRGIEERVKALGGTLTLDSLPNQGCCITAQLPINA